MEAVYADENVWLSQKMMAQLYDVEVPTINYHLKKVFEDSELEEDSVVRNFRIPAADGKTYDTKHYNLSAIIAVGYKVNSERAVQFRKWATRVVEEFTIKGFAMDDERLKRGGSVLSDKYFEEQLQRVREIRLSERKFYQKNTDIYATSVDYDVTAQATKRFFATVQNKLHWAIHGQTAAEVIVERADATKGEGYAAQGQEAVTLAQDQVPAFTSPALALHNASTFALPPAPAPTPRTPRSARNAPTWAPWWRSSASPSTRLQRAVFGSDRANRASTAERCTLRRGTRRPFWVGVSSKTYESETVPILWTESVRKRLPMRSYAEPRGERLGAFFFPSIARLS